MSDLMIETFQKITDEMREKYRQAVYDRYLNRVESYIEKVVGKTDREIFKNSWEPIYRDRSMIRDCFDDDGSNSGGYKYTKLNKKKAEKYAKREADYSTSMLFDGFVAKNVAKMEGVLKGLKVENIKLNLSGNLQGNMVVVCEKNASFSMSFQIEYAYSKLNKLFGRFPTRFHDATKTDGTKIKSASESKMKKEFC